MTASAVPAKVNLGSFTAGTFAAGNFSINNQAITGAMANTTALLTAINGLTGVTGVAATTNTANEVVLSVMDGRNIKIETNGLGSSGDFSRFGLQDGSADSEVQSGAN